MESERSPKTEKSVSLGEQRGVRREIPGNLPYTASTGRLAEALRGLISAERPQKFNEGFLDGVLGMRGGSARTIPPIFKKVGLLNPDNSPTDLYSKFKSEYSRADAALTALKTGYKEIFRKNEYAHRLSDERIRDIIVEITGLKKGDTIVSSISGTFNAFNEYAKEASDTAAEVNPQSSTPYPPPPSEKPFSSPDRSFNLVNTINIVLPETTDIQVYNAIFKSIRDNLVE